MLQPGAQPTYQFMFDDGRLAERLRVSGDIHVEGAGHWSPERLADGALGISLAGGDPVRITAAVNVLKRLPDDQTRNYAALVLESTGSQQQGPRVLILDERDPPGGAPSVTTIGDRAEQSLFPNGENRQEIAGSLETARLVLDAAVNGPGRAPARALLEFLRRTAALANTRAAQEMDLPRPTIPDDTTLAVYVYQGDPTTEFAPRG